MHPWTGGKYLAGRALQREGRCIFINLRVQLKKKKFKKSVAFTGAALGLYCPPVTDGAPVMCTGDTRAVTPSVRSGFD